VTAAPGWAWAVAGCVILVLLAIDLLVNRGQPGMRRAVLVSVAWVGAGTVFGIAVTVWQGGDAGQQYFTAYLVEKALSIDNIFVFVLLFRAFAVPAAYQHRVLFAGVLGALALRGGFIAAGAALLEHLSWAFYAFGAFLLVAALRMARGGVRADPRRGLMLRGLRKVVPMSEDFDGPRFLTRRDGRLYATPLLAVLVAIETTDVIFAADSIPAAFGVTTDMFIIFTSNAFAVLGLRALYFVLADAMERFTYLSQGLAIMLAFIGVKMILADLVHIPTVASLGVIITIITAAVLLSVWKRRRQVAARAAALPPAAPNEPALPAAASPKAAPPAAASNGPALAAAAPPARVPPKAVQPEAAHSKAAASEVGRSYA
jgi:tellurite resistance protein TerC